jgi:hypothetical protein
MAIYTMVNEDHTVHVARSFMALWESIDVFFDSTKLWFDKDKTIPVTRSLLKKRLQTRRKSVFLYRNGNSFLIVCRH